MTLRLRLALWFGLVVVVGIGAASVLAYASTENELAETTDDFLETRANDFAEGVRLLPDADNGRSDKNDRNSGDGRDDNDGNDGTNPDLGDVVDTFSTDADSVVQTLTVDDAVSSSGPLPVDEVDLQVAKGGPPVLRDVTFNDVEYRMITRHIPGQGAVQVARETAETSAVLSALGTRLAVIGALVTIGAAAVGWVVAARATRPLRRLSSTAEHIAATQDLTTPVPGGGRDEVGTLAGSLDQMIDALATSQAQQQRLVMDAGHELRTPLTSLRANAELLARAPDLDASTRNEVIEGITSEVEELSSLVTELVELATDNRADDAPAEPIDLLDLADAAASRTGRRSDRTITVTGSSTIVSGRPALLDRAIGNLLGNAHKFSPAGAPIEVHVADGAVSVRDHGPGIDTEDLPLIFDRFYRATASRTMPGSGLGLAIVAQIVERHEGATTAGNHPDGGAVVGFVLPVASRGDTFDA